MTQQQPPSEDRDAARARACLDAYGGDPARWPAADRALFASLGETARADAARLDAALDQVTAPAAGAALEEAVLAGYAARRHGPSFLSRFGFGSGDSVRRLIPAGALAGLSALGFLAGAATAGAAYAGADDPLYYAQATATVAIDEEDAFWASE